MQWLWKRSKLVPLNTDFQIQFSDAYKEQCYTGKTAAPTFREEPWKFLCDIFRNTCVSNITKGQSRMNSTYGVPLWSFLHVTAISLLHGLQFLAFSIDHNTSPLVPFSFYEQAWDQMSFTWLFLPYSQVEYYQNKNLTLKNRVIMVLCNHFFAPTIL